MPGVSAAERGEPPMRSLGIDAARAAFTGKAGAGTVAARAPDGAAPCAHGADLPGRRDGVLLRALDAACGRPPSATGSRRQHRGRRQRADGARAARRARKTEARGTLRATCSTPSGGPGGARPTPPGNALRSSVRNKAARARVLLDTRPGAYHLSKPSVWRRLDG